MDFVLALAVPPIAGGRRNQLQVRQNPYPVCTRIQRENCNISRNLIVVGNSNMNRAVVPLPHTRPYRMKRKTGQQWRARLRLAYREMDEACGWLARSRERCNLKHPQRPGRPINTLTEALESSHNSPKT